MTKYYSGQRPPYSRAQPRTETHVLKRTAWILSAFMSGYFLSAVYDVTSFKQLINTQIVGVYFNQSKQSVLVKAPTAPPKPKFEFYTMLAKGGTVIPVESAAQPHVEIVSVNQPSVLAKPHTTTAENLSSKSFDGQYLVQLAAFGNHADAEKMKAALAIKGFTVSIVASTQNHAQWFRVVLGPFSTKGDAEAAQHAVAERERISGMVRKASA
jgi:cell division protein FtsN